MSEWPKICYHRSHWNNPVLATDRWEHGNGQAFNTCRYHSQYYGPMWQLQGFKWEPLPDTSQAQPTRERVKP